MGKSKQTSCDRRNFLKGAATGAAALLASAPAVEAQQPEPERHTAPLPSAHQIALETNPPVARTDVYTTDRPGADFMVNVLKSLKFDYICANPGSSFRGLQESFVNYGGNQDPEWITCCHEESSVAMAHGYFKIEGKPLLIMAHGTVGLQHASMAIYNAYADRVPVFIILGNEQEINFRRGDVEWKHSVQDAASMVRDYTKWDGLSGLAGALRRIRREGVQSRYDSAHGAGGHLGEWPASGRACPGAGSPGAAYP